jgi:hypothetical protein
MKFRWIAMFCILFCSSLLGSCGSGKSYMNGSIGYVSPGATADYSIYLSYCTQGHWATNGLHFTLAAPDGSLFFEKTITRPRDWDASLDTSKKQKQAYFEIEVPVPENQAAGTLFTGSLTGEIDCPITDDVDATAIVDKKVELHVASADEIKTMSKDAFWNDLKMVCYGLICIFIMAGISTIAQKMNRNNPLKPRIRL